LGLVSRFIARGGAMTSLAIAPTPDARSAAVETRTADIVLPDPILDALSELYWLEREQGEPILRPDVSSPSPKSH
jgi:hypothetical protein